MNKHLNDSGLLNTCHIDIQIVELLQTQVMLFRIQSKFLTLGHWCLKSMNSGLGRAILPYFKNHEILKQRMGAQK